MKSSMKSSNKSGISNGSASDLRHGMETGINCAAFHENLVLAAYRELPDDQAHALALHLKGCGECQQEQQQLEALITLASARPMLEPDANLVARSRVRLEESLDAIPPKQWYDRVAEWMTRTASALQAAPVAACLLLVAGSGLGSMAGYWFAERHAINVAGSGSTLPTGAGLSAIHKDLLASPPATGNAPALTSADGMPFGAGEVAAISSVMRQPNSKLVEVNYNQVEPKRVQGTLEDPKIRQLLMLASQNGTSPTVRDNSVELLAAECRTAAGCEAGQRATIKDALMVALRYDRNTAVRQKALSGLEPYVADDLQVRNAVLEALMNDPDAHIRSAAISLLQPVEADTSVRQVLSTVALSDHNSNIRNASRVVLRRVSEIQ